VIDEIMAGRGRFLAPYRTMETPSSNGSPSHA